MLHVMTLLLLIKGWTVLGHVLEVVLLWVIVRVDVLLRDMLIHVGGLNVIVVLRCACTPRQSRCF